jgi:hypothetical protein
MFVLSMLISFAMICACQKRDSAAKAQLAQRKAELDTREKALDEREKALSRRPVVEPEEAKAERYRRLQQLPPELQALIRDRLLLDARTAEKSRGPSRRTTASSRSGTQKEDERDSISQRRNF